MTRQEKHAVADKDQNKLQRGTKILIRGMTAARGVRRAKGQDNLSKYLHYSSSGRKSEENILCIMLGVKVRTVKAH